jgi:hypothetical protein
MPLSVEQALCVLDDAVQAYHEKISDISRQEKEMIAAAAAAAEEDAMYLNTIMQLEADKKKLEDEFRVLSMRTKFANREMLLGVDNWMDWVRSELDTALVPVSRVEAGGVITTIASLYIPQSSNAVATVYISCTESAVGSDAWLKQRAAMLQAVKACNPGQSPIGALLLHVGDGVESLNELSLVDCRWFASCGEAELCACLVSLCATYARTKTSEPRSWPVISSTIATAVCSIATAMLNLPTHSMALTAPERGHVDDLYLSVKNVMPDSEDRRSILRALDLLKASS